MDNFLPLKRQKCLKWAPSSFLQYFDWFCRKKHREKSKKRIPTHKLSNPRKILTFARSLLLQSCSERLSVNTVPQFLLASTWKPALETLFHAQVFPLRTHSSHTRFFCLNVKQIRAWFMDGNHSCRGYFGNEKNIRANFPLGQLLLKKRVRERTCWFLGFLVLISTPGTF